MSDSVDRVFVHALATVRRLPRTGSSRPPPSARLQLYGLYKQSMEGDVSSILPRPTLPPQSPDPNSNNPGNNSVHRYASRDLRTRETQAEIEKWDAWHACAGMSRTEAKRRYISTLIDTMKAYASGTSESRELVAELEFVWNQIRSQSGSDESEEGESPTRKLERAGLKQPGMPRRRSPGLEGSTSIFGRLEGSEGKDGGETTDSQSGLRRDKTSRPQDPGQQVSSRSRGLRVLSPMSQRSSDDIVLNEELPPEPIPDDDEDDADADPEDDDEYASASEDKLDQDPSANQSRPLPSSSPPPLAPTPPDITHWRTSMESHLRHLSTELAALREQLSTHHMLTRSSFYSASSLPLRRRIFLRISQWMRWLFWTTVRQACIQLGLLVVVLIWGRLRGDRRAENWCRERFREFQSWAGYVLRGARESDLIHVAGRLKVG